MIKYDTPPKWECWFCVKGKHDDCMKKLSYDSKEDDCSFSTLYYDCECFKNGHKKGKKD